MFFVCFYPSPSSGRFRVEHASEPQTRVVELGRVDLELVGYAILIDEQQIEPVAHEIGLDPAGRYDPIMYDETQALQVVYDALEANFTKY